MTGEHADPAESHWADDLSADDSADDSADEPGGGRGGWSDPEPDLTPATRGRRPNDPAAPHGPAQVRPAVLGAAAELFAQRGIASVSLREVARQAGVNPSLITRYVGDKDALVLAVLAELYDQITGEIDAYLEDVRSLPAPTPNQTVDLYTRIAAHLVVEGHDLERFKPGFPLIRHVIELIAEDGEDPAVARRRGALIFTLELSAHLFGQSMLLSAGLRAEDAADLAAMVRRISLAIGDGLPELTDPANPPTT